MRIGRSGSSGVWCRFFLILVFFCGPLAGVHALENDDRDPILADLSENREEAVLQIVRRSFRQAGLLAKIDAQKETYKAQIARLHGEFKILYKEETASDPLSLFWDEMDTGLLPSVEANDERAAARSFLRLNKLYQQCCELPTRDHLVATVREGGDVSHVELNALQADVLRESRQSAGDLSLTFILALGVSGIAIALIAGLYILYRLRRNQQRHPHAEGVAAKPLYLQDEQSKAHANLDEIMSAFREKLFAFGPPNIKNEQLFFGEYLIDGDTQIVDELEAAFGCFATIFKKDMRVSTNIILPDETRALGTVLDQGPRYDTLMIEKKSFAGEVELFEHKILALYEPVVIEGEVIALLFTGIRLHEAEEERE